MSNSAFIGGSVKEASVSGQYHLTKRKVKCSNASCCYIGKGSSTGFSITIS